MERVHRLLIRGLWLLLSPFSVSNWRYMLTRQTKARVHLSSGRYVDVYCESWTVNMSKGSKKYEFIGLRKTVSFDVSEIIAVEER